MDKYEHCELPLLGVIQIQEWHQIGTLRVNKRSFQGQTSLQDDHISSSHAENFSDYHTAEVLLGSRPVGRLPPTPMYGPCQY